MPRRSRSRDRVKPETKEETKVKTEVIDLEEDIVLVTSSVKSEVKREPKEKKHKVKKEKDKDKDDGGTGRAKDKGKEKNSRRRRRSRSESRRSHSDSSSSSSSSSSESALYRKFKPYTKVQLVNLVRKADLNGMTGTIVHPSMAVSPCPPGCILVRLETGREIAVKPPNVAPLRAFHHGPMQAPLSQEERLQQVLKTIKLNIDNVMERTMALRDGEGSHAIMDDPGRIQGGIGHML